MCLETSNLSQDFLWTFWQVNSFSLWALDDALNCAFAQISFFSSPIFLPLPFLPPASPPVILTWNIFIIKFPFQTLPMFHNCDKTTVNEFMMAGKWGRCNWKEYGGGEEGRGALWIMFSWQTISLVTLVSFSVRKRHSQLDILYDPTQISIVHLFTSRIQTFFYLKGHTRMARWFSHWYHLLPIKRTQDT